MLTSTGMRSSLSPELSSGRPLKRANLPKQPSLSSLVQTAAAAAEIMEGMTHLRGEERPAARAGVVDQDIRPNSIGMTLVDSEAFDIPSGDSDSCIGSIQTQVILGATWNYTSWYQAAIVFTCSVRRRNRDLGRVLILAWLVDKSRRIHFTEPTPGQDQESMTAFKHISTKFLSMPYLKLAAGSHRKPIWVCTFLSP